MTSTCQCRRRTSRNRHQHMLQRTCTSSMPFWERGKTSSSQTAEIGSPPGLHSGSKSKIGACAPRTRRSFRSACLWMPLSGTSSLKASRNRLWSHPRSRCSKRYC
ncbi:unnamed protein product [Symbiodinium necroappetens]|uniref:Uncharacterized protein n=1 Tax=Symbiodinium necroappetens TaxID=1628268 RepID=A0A812YTA7_9DINO|nr:unnamed protein product [Symbiodinium necroappetens]